MKKIAANNSGNKKLKPFTVFRKITDSKGVSFEKN
jgi:hypothetical protein